MRTITLDEFLREVRAQGVPQEHIAFRCVICSTVQSATDLMRAGAGKTFEDVEKYLGFSCVGRWTGAGSHREGAASGRGCDWTLGGLLGLHQLTVVTPDGQKHPRFELATPKEAKDHMAAMRQAEGEA